MKLDRAGHSLADLDLGDHLYCLYATEAERQVLLTPLLRQGLERGEQVLYFVDAGIGETAPAYLREDGLDVDVYLSAGQLQIVSAIDGYRSGDAFDPERMIATLQAETDRALAEGYTALRVIEEMTWVLQALSGLEALIEYEDKLNLFLPGSRCLAICQYDRRRFDPAVLRRAMEAHPLVAIGSEICKNFYYTPPAEQLGQDQEAATLNRWLDHLANYKETQKALQYGEAHFRVLVENSVVGIWHIDRDGHTLYANEALGCLLDIEDAAALTGKPYHDFFPPESLARIEEELARRWQGHASSYEVKRVGMDGETRHLLVSGVPLVGEDGSVESAIATCVNISELKQAEEALVEERNLLRTLIDNLPDYIYVKDTESRFILNNRAHLRQLGAASQEEVVGRTDFDFFPREMAEQYYADEQHVLASGQPLIGREEITADWEGQEQWVLTTKVPLRDTQNRVTGLVGLSRAITEWKRAEQELYERQAHLEAVFDQAALGIATVDLDGRLQDWNRTFVQMFAYSPEELQGLAYADLIHPDYRVENLVLFEELVAGERDSFQVEKRCIRRDGRQLWCKTVASLVRDANGAPSFVVRMVADITRRKQAEAELRQRELQLQEAQHLAQLGNWEWHIPTDTLSWSPEMYRIHGLEPTKSPLSYERFLERVHPDDREFARRTVEQAYRNRSSFSFEHRIVRPDGTVRSLQGRGRVVLDEDGQPVRMVGTGQDITERKEMEESLRQSRALFERLVESAPDGIVLVGSDGRIVQVNRQTETLFGYDRDDLVGEPVEVLVPERLRDRHVRTRAAYQDAPSSRPMGAGLELYGQRRDGDRFPVDILLRPMQIGGDEVTLAVVRDITARKQAEMELAEVHRRLSQQRESERLHLARELHDAPVQDLHVVEYQLQALAHNLNDEENRAKLESAYTQLQMVNRTLRHLCNDLRPPALEEFGLTVALRSLAEQFQQAHPDLDIHLNLADDNRELLQWTGLALYRVCQQALNNIVQHAAASQVWIELAVDEERISLQVRDDGQGFHVPAHWVGLVRQGHLGLAGMAERVEDIGGTFKVNSIPGDGTAIQVSVPRSGSGST